MLKIFFGDMSDAVYNTASILNMIMKMNGL